MRGVSAFREAYFSDDQPSSLDYNSYQARQLRYAVYWAYFENSAYRNVHSFARAQRSDYGLYAYIRGIHNPSFRLGEVYANLLWGGALDHDAGNGEQTPSALPIKTDNDALRPAIARLWRDSNWQVRKAIVPRYGAILGDVAIKVNDDPQREMVTLDVVHPAMLRDVLFDDMGNIKAYVIHDERNDPESTMRRFTVSPEDMPQTKRKVTYTEIAVREDDAVVYRTYKNGVLYNWSSDPTAPSEWKIPYGFIPMVLIAHLDVGSEWGWSELQAGLPKFREVDDLASKLDDQIRKMVDAPWMFSGVPDPRKQLALPRRENDPRRDNPEQGREQSNVLYAPSGATATPLVAPLDIAASSQRIQAIIEEIERDYPELQMDIWNAAGAQSGRALRLARQRVTTKIQARRANYDNALVRAQQMAIAIGGMRGYTAYRGFSLESYALGDLDHMISERPVFETDPLDDLEEEAMFWAVAEAAKNAGIPLDVFLERRQADPLLIAAARPMQQDNITEEDMNARREQSDAFER